MNIKTVLGEFKIQKTFFIDDYNISHFIENIYKKNIQKKEILSSIFDSRKLSFLNLLNKYSINFKSDIFIQLQIKNFLKNDFLHSKIFLIGSNIKLEKKQNKKIFSEKIDSLKIFINFKKQNFKSKWILKKTNKSLKKNIIYGYLNIFSINNKKDIDGKLYIINFPISFFNFFTTNNNKIKGVLKSTIKFLGTVDQPKILADVNIQDILIRSNNLFKYITVFFPYLPKKISTIKITQDILIKQGNISFDLHPCINHSDNLEWYLIFNSKTISFLFFPKVKINFSSYLNVHYLLLQYDLLGFIKLPFFYFKINKKNFIV